MTFWLNGHLYPDGASPISPRDRGFTLGDGLYETIKIMDGTACWADRHLRRLQSGAEQLCISLSWSPEAINAAIDETISLNHIQAGTVRLTLSRGPAERGLPLPDLPEPTLVIAAAAGLPPIAPLRLIVSKQTRRNEHSPLAGIKSLNTLDSVLARIEANERGADDAILLNTRGVVAEATAANLILYRTGVFVTPLAADGALPGTARQLVIERTGAVQRSVSIEDINRADAVFLSSCLGIRPVTEIDGRTIPMRHDLLDALQACLRFSPSKARALFGASSTLPSYAGSGLTGAC